MKKGTIFIVEDDLVSAQYLKELLELEGFTVAGIADNAHDVLEKLGKCSVDVVLMDIMLKGGMSGAETAVLLKQMHSECKIIFLTAYADEEMVEYALDAKADAYLLKPYREQEITATIKIVLNDPSKKLNNKDNIKLKDGFVYDFTRDIFLKNGIEIPLSEKKHTLIKILAHNKDSVVSNEQLCISIWGETKHDSNLRSLVSRFKSTIDDDIIINANGRGYMIRSED